MNTTELIAILRERYAEPAAPTCHICGAEMTIQAISSIRIAYGCTGATYDDSGCHYAPGRNIADDHYADSRVTVANSADPDVLALVEALESAQQENTDGVAGMAESYETTISMLRSRIAELEGRAVKFPPKVERDDSDGYWMLKGQRVSAANAAYYNEALKDVALALFAAGIKCEVKGS